MTRTNDKTGEIGKITSPQMVVAVFSADGDLHAEQL
jgi:hypothetical protein